MESLSQYSKDVREELKLSLQEVYNRTDIDVTLLGYKMFDLASRRYIGNKAKLTPWIMNIINEHTGGFESFLMSLREPHLFPRLRYLMQRE